MGDAARGERLRMGTVAITRLIIPADRTCSAPEWGFFRAAGGARRVARSVLATSPEGPQGEALDGGRENKRPGKIPRPE